MYPFPSGSLWMIYPAISEEKKMSWGIVSSSERGIVSSSERPRQRFSCPEIDLMPIDN